MLALLVGAHVVFAAVFWSTTWDDSAITLAYARTLAFDGLIAPTRFSSIVEGYSTTLWMLLNALLAPLAGSPGATLTTAKILGLAFNAVAIGLTYRLARRHLDARFALAVVALFGTLSIAWVESVNGMETPLLASLLLLAILTYNKEGTRSHLIFLIASTLFLLVRWEAAWYLVPFVIVTLLRRGPRGLFRLEHLVWAAAFIGTSLWRHAYFGAWVPNTILAKSHPPYHPDYGLVASAIQHVKPLVVIVLALVPLGLGLLAILHSGPNKGERSRILRGWLRRSLADPHRLLVLVVLAGIVFNVAIGHNWGPKNRMFYIAFPPLLILLVGLARQIYQAATRKRRRIIRSIFIASVALNGLVGLVWAAYAQRNEGITISSIAGIAEGVEAIRLAAGADRMTYAAADMGALLLFHGDNLRVLDLALLCDSTLAHLGYEAAPAYLFEKERPDLIETHWMWTPLVGFAEEEAFFRDYVPVFSNGLRFFARREVVEAIDTARLTPGTFDEDGDTDAYDRDHFVYSVQLEWDFDLNRRFGSYLALDAEL